MNSDPLNTKRKYFGHIENTSFILRNIICSASFQFLLYVYLSLINSADKVGTKRVFIISYKILSYFIVIVIVFLTQCHFEY